MDDPDRLPDQCTQCADSTASGRVDPSGAAERARMLAHSRRHATVLTISGEIDAANGDRVQAFATGLIQAGNALAIDLSGVDFFGAQGISVLMAVDDACRAAEVRWALVPSRKVSRVLQLTACDTTLPTASSVSDALRQVTALSQARPAVY